MKKHQSKMDIIEERRQLQKMIDYLLKPMNLTTRYASIKPYNDANMQLSGPFKLIELQNNLDVFYENDPWKEKLLFGSLNRVLDKLKKIHHFIVKERANQMVKNIYFGCSSLEEMLIRKDLIAQQKWEKI